MNDYNIVLLLVRVSTTQQSFDEQKTDLIRAAQKIGYKEVGKDILIVDGKESAIHLKESERETIIEMKKYIETVRNIDRLLIWELSRLSRRPADLYSLRDYLQDKKIQLTCLKPEFNLFNEVDFSVNELANISFSIFSTMAENEMIIKKARFKRSKDRNAEQGRFSGGKPKLGYIADANNYYIIDEKTAPTIRAIYDMYVNQRMSMHRIHDELAHQGISMSFTSIRYVLKDKSYYGEKTAFRRDNLERRFPAIISKEMYEKAAELRESNRISCKNTPNNYGFLGLHIITCWDCGMHLSAKPKNCCYFCVRHSYPYQSQRQEPCKNCCNVRADVADSLLWQLAKRDYLVLLESKSKEEYENLKSIKEVLRSKIDNSDSMLLSLSERLEMNENSHIMGLISDKSYQINKNKLQVQKEKLTIDIEQWQIQINATDEKISIIESNNKKNPNQTRDLLNNMNNITDTQEMIRIIRLFIKSMYVRYLRAGTKDKVFHVVFISGSEEFYLQKTFKTHLNRIRLCGNNYEVIDKEVGFSFEYVKMHPTQQEFYPWRESLSKGDTT